MSRARARQFFSSGLGFGLETQKPGLGLETCWTRTRVLRIWTRTRDMRTRTRLGLEETRTRCISGESYVESSRARGNRAPAQPSIYQEQMETAQSNMSENILGQQMQLMQEMFRMLSTQNAHMRNQLENRNTLRVKPSGSGTSFHSRRSSRTVVKSTDGQRKRNF